MAGAFRVNCCFAVIDLLQAAGLNGRREQLLWVLAVTQNLAPAMSGWGFSYCRADRFRSARSAQSLIMNRGSVSGRLIVERRHTLVLL